MLQMYCNIIYPAMLYTCTYKHKDFNIHVITILKKTSKVGKYWFEPKPVNKC